MHPNTYLWAQCVWYPFSARNKCSMWQGVSAGVNFTHLFGRVCRKYGVMPPDGTSARAYAVKEFCSQLNGLQIPATKSSNPSLHIT